MYGCIQREEEDFHVLEANEKIDDMNPYELAARSVYVIAKVVNYCSREEAEAGDITWRIERADQLQRCWMNGSSI